MSTVFPSDLVRALANDQLVPFVGSGVSYGIGHHPNDPKQPLFPSWSGLLCKLATALKPGHHSIVETYIQENELNEAARTAFKNLSPDQFRRLMMETFDINEPSTGLDLSLPDAIWSLRPKLIMTTNYERVLEWSNPKSRPIRNDSVNIADVFNGTTESPKVWHVHGHVAESSSFILAPQQYDELYRNAHDPKHPQAAAMIHWQSLLARSPLLFIGFGLQDAYVMELIARVFDTFRRGTQTHYALMKHGAVPCPELWKKYNIEVIEYAGFGPPLLTMLAELKQAADQARGTASHGPATHPVVSLSPLKNSPAVAAYLERLAASTAKLSLAGMGRGMPIELPIQAAYVPLRAKLVRSLRQLETDRLKDGLGEYESDLELKDVFRRCVENQQRGALLLGEPGAGKTTGARQLAWLLSSGTCSPEELGLPNGIIPVLLKFRNLSKEFLINESNGLQQFLQQETHSDSVADELKDPGPELWNSQTPLLWLLDGLDEIMDPQVRERVTGWVREALQHRTRDWFLVTSRYQGYEQMKHPLGPKFERFEVRPLDDDQIASFVRKWFGIVYRHLNDPTADAKAEADSNKLLEIFQQRRAEIGGMGQLASNPLLLTIVCIVFYDKRHLPTGRADLYSLCVQVLLQDWRQELYASDAVAESRRFDGAAARLVLARLAWWMHQEQDRTAAPWTELAEQATDALTTISESARLGRAGDTFLKRMRTEAGILAMSGEGEGKVGFLHKTFQEYLAAEHAAANGKAKFLAGHVANDWWQEAVLLSLRTPGSQHCEEFFNALIKQGTAEDDFALVDRCLNESLMFPKQTLLKWLKHRSTKPERRAALLRLLKSRTAQMPELIDECRKLATHVDADLRAVADEILGKRSVILQPISVPLDGEDASVAQLAGDTWTDDRTGITYVWIPKGTFIMGSDNSPYDDEKPARPVTIDKPFWLGRYPVTNAQYAKYLQANAQAEKPEYWSDRRFNQPEQPVVGVSWHDATAFSAWAQARLPTEEEWERACRAGTTTEYFFSDDPQQLADYAWFWGNSDGQSHPVGLKRPNAWGLYDMHGNVWEWCNSWYNGKQEGRVLRGGSWNDVLRYCRSSIRSDLRPEYRLINSGFRVART